jgi:hypothetical protein
LSGEKAWYGDFVPPFLDGRGMGFFIARTSPCITRVTKFVRRRRLQRVNEPWRCFSWFNFDVDQGDDF